MVVNFYTCHGSVCLVPKNERRLHLLANCGACGLGRGAGWWAQHPTQLLGATPQPHSSPPHTTPQSPEQPTHKAWSTKRTLPLKLEAPSATNTILFLQLARKNKSHVCFLGTLQIVRANMQEELTGSSAKTKVSMQCNGSN